MDIRNLSLKWYIAAFLLFALWCLHDPAKADFSYFAEGGLTKYEQPDSAWWHQKDGGYAGTLDNSAAAFRFGGEYGNDTVGVRLSYADLNEYGTDAFATSDEDCANHTGPNAVDNCGGVVSQFKTRGGFRVFGLTVIGRTPMFLGVRVTGEAGVLSVRQSFHVHVNDFDYNEQLRGTGKFFALGFEARRVTLSLQFYSSNVGTNFNSNEFPSGVSYAYVVMVGFRG